MFVSAVRNRDMSWPEEMSSLANNRSLREKLNLGMSLEAATAPYLYLEASIVTLINASGLFCVIFKGEFFRLAMFFTLHILYRYLIVTYLHSIKAILKFSRVEGGLKSSCKFT